MKVFRSITIGLAAAVLSLGAIGAAHAQQQSTGQRTGGMSGGGMSGGGLSGGGMSSGGMSQGQSQTGMQTGQIPASQQSPNSQSTTGLSSLPGTDDAPLNARTEMDMERLRNGERQKKLLADTDKLLLLVNELKTDMDKTNKDTLSLDVIRKADEIEKLAHAVKEKMRGP